MWTGGGIDKREIYRRLGVPEVWVWYEGELVVHALRNDAYQVVPRSEQFPSLDLRLMPSFATAT
jgi:hypothetical protein